MITQLEPEEFFSKRNALTVIDVRAPKEYSRGHIPGAVNIPLFNDEERSMVGTLYVQQGRNEAIVKALELAGPKLKSLVEQSLSAAPGREVLLQCWRGGMRSESFAWLLNMAGFNVGLLTGGYKAYRRWVRSYFDKPYKINIIGGMTGTGKTQILRELGKLGEQVVDLEALANHKGSAFGMIGEKPQPSNEQFENELHLKLVAIDPAKTLWLEDESYKIGTVVLPEAFFEQMKNAPVYQINLSQEHRVTRLTQDYAGFDKTLLQQAFMRIKTKLGSEEALKAVRYLDEGNYGPAVKIALNYYDKTYSYLISKRHSAYVIETGTPDEKANAQKLLDFYRQQGA